MTKNQSAILGDDGGKVWFIADYLKYLSGDLAAALLLSQIFFWYRPDKVGGSKLRVRKHGMWWIAKSNAEWQEETGMTAMQIRRASAVLKEREIVDSKVMRFDGSPTVHYRLCALKGRRDVLDQPKQVLKCYWTHLELMPVTNPSATTNKFLTETTAENTTGTSAPSEPLGETGEEKKLKYEIKPIQKEVPYKPPQEEIDALMAIMGKGKNEIASLGKAFTY
jgi:hypothetical protein